MGRRTKGALLLGAAALGVVGVTGYLVLQDGGGSRFFSGDECSASVQGREVLLSVEQAQNAALISAVSVQRGMPARAATIALATAYQESKLYNIESGDRDSLGLFQQRPSQGWGTPEQILDPYYSTNAFYDSLVGVDGYETMRVTEAAQRVQRSAFPEAYADHEADARVLASALTGESDRSFSCDIDADAAPASDRINAIGLTGRADAVRFDVEAAYGDLVMGGFAPDGVETGHMQNSTHYQGRAVDIFLQPVSETNRRKGWSIAAYLVAHADRLSVQTVIFDDRIWKAVDAGAGWQDYDPPARSGDPVILEHRDHVHIDVFD